MKITGMLFVLVLLSTLAYCSKLIPLITSGKIFKSIPTIEPLKRNNTRKINNGFSQIINNIKNANKKKKDKNYAGTEKVIKIIEALKKKYGK